MQFLTFKQQQYIVLPRETPGKCGYIDVFVQNNGKYERYWSLMPSPSYPLIVFTNVIQNNLLLTINQKGELRLFNLNHKEELAAANIGATQLFGAGIYPSGRKGFIAEKNHEHKGIDILEFELKTLKTSFNQTIKGIFKLGSLTVLEENLLAGYTPVGSMEGINSSDGFITIDTKKQSYKQHYLRPSPSGNYSQPPVVFDPRSKMGIRPAFDSIEINNGQEEKLYLAKALLFDLYTGKRIRNITIREFSASDLFEDKNPEYALSCLELPPYSEDYCDVKEEFLERFEAFQFCHREDAFWVTFQHGILRKLSFEGQYKSPLIAHPGDPTLQSLNKLLRTGFDTPLTLSPDDCFLAFGKPSITVKTAELVKPGSNRIFLIPESMVLETNAVKNSTNISAFSWNKLDIDSITSQGDIAEGLVKLKKATENISPLLDGSFLRFCFNTPDGVLSERQLCNKIVWDKDYCSIGRQIIENLITYGKPLWHDKATPSLFFIMRKLVLQSANNLEILLRYVQLCSECQAEEDNLKELIDEVIVKYGWQKETIDLILTRATFQSEKGLEQLETYLKQPEFEIYQANPLNKKYFQEHSLFKSLADEYFSLFFPDEEQLFAAIESEDINKLEKLLERPLKLDQIHPEFNLTPLDLAMEMGNKDMVNLLSSADANSPNAISDNGLSVHSDSFGKDISVDKAMRTLLINLHHQKEELQKKIYDIEFNHMLNFSLSPGQSALLDSMNKELEDIQSQIKYANLGLLSLEDLSSSPTSEEISPFQQNKGVKEINRAGEFISDRSYAYEDPFITVIEIEGTGEKSQLYAFERMKTLLENAEHSILNQVLRYNFEIAGKLVSEPDYFQQIQLTERTTHKLSEFIQKLGDTAKNPIWYDDETPGGFYAVQKLAFVSENTLEDLIFYLKSNIVDEEEPGCITDLIFDIYEHYGWNLSTLSLVAFRLCRKGSPSGLSEFRIQWKKGGLESFFQKPEIKEAFLRLLDRQCCIDRIEWFHQFTNDG